MEELRIVLQAEVGTSPKIELSPFRNWSGTERRDAVLTATPASVEEARAVIRAAKARGLSIRASGTRFSWTPLCADEGNVVLYTTKLQRPGPQIQLIQDPENPGGKLVTLAGSTTVADFMQFQLQNNVCFPASPAISAVTMAGIVSTASHGSGKEVQTVSDYITSMRVIDSEGVVREFSKRSDADMLLAAQCSLGLWGIILDLTVKVEPMFIVDTINHWKKVKDVFHNKEYLKEAVFGNYSVQMFWYPFSGISAGEAFEAILQRDIDLDDWDPMEDFVLVRVVNKSSKTTAADQPEPVKRNEYSAWLNSKFSTIADGVITTAPQLAPAFMRFTQYKMENKLINGRLLTQKLPHAIHFYDQEDTAPYSNIEWCFKLDRECQSLSTATQRVIELVRREALDGRFPMNLAMEVRFCKDSNAYLASAQKGTGITCYIDLLGLVGTPGWDEFARQISSTLNELPGAVPHWAKSSGIPKLSEPGFIQKALESQIPKFKKALQKSGVDPTGMFINAYLESILYPGGHPGKNRKN